jgi:DNA-binding IclR family transcriptional regulator
MNMPKTTLHGLLATLKDFGYVEQPSFEGRYKLGMSLVEIGTKFINNLDVRKIAAKHIQRLVEDTDETVHLTTLSKGEVLYIDKHESSKSIRLITEIGARLPVHCTGVGKALIAYLPPDEIARIVELKALTRYTKNTITDPQKLTIELAKVRKQGYAEDNEEILEGLICIAAPIWDHTGVVCSAISISGPSFRLTAAAVNHMKKRIVETAKDISLDLGWGK